MRALYIMAILLFSGLSARPQELAKKIYFPERYLKPIAFTGQAPKHINAKSTTVQCGVDTIVYPYFKELSLTSGNDSFFIDAMVGNVRTASQAYRLNDSLNVIGAQFWGAAYSTSTDPQTLQVVVYLYSVDNNYMPVSVIDSSIITITEQYAFYTAIFPSAHTLTGNYAVGVRSLAVDTLAVMTNNAGATWQTTAYNEGLGWRRFGSGAWNSSLSFFGQDLEYMIFPIVDYSITSDFVATDDSVCINTTQTFTNQSSPILTERTYNLNAFAQYFGLAPADSTFTWTYGDGSPSVTAANGSYTYTSSGTMNVQLEADMAGYYTGCSEIRTVPLEVMDSASITVQPDDSLIFAGDPATFSVTATGAMNYYWQVSTDNGNSWNTLSNGGWYSNVDSSTLSIMGADITADSNMYRIVITSLCGSDTSLPAMLTVSVPLAVNMLSFDAKLQGDDVFLTWQTASELNSDYFEIARSADGKNFKALGRVQSQGDRKSGRQYRFIDEQPLHGYNIYRLLQYDLNGKMVNHGVRTVIMNNGPAATLNIFPNPARSAFTVVTNGPARISIADMAGRNIRTVEVNGATTISTDGMSSGVYLLNIEYNGMKHIEKLLIEKN